MGMRHGVKGELDLMAHLWDPLIADDLEAFVLFAYPWGKEGTPLEGKKGPRTWQRDDLQEMTAHLREQKARMKQGLEPAMWRKATAAGRGVGKSSLLAWLTDWMMTCRIGSTTIITANTEPQLKSRTFAEIGRWTTMLINAHWFESNVLTIFPAPWFRKSIEENLKIDTGYYYAQGQLWSEENPDAFAGIHNQYGVNLLMDEGSGIPNSIFNVAHFFFTEPVLYRFWNVYSNPRRNSGAFFDCFHDPNTMNMWKRRHIDIRTVEGIDIAMAEEMIAHRGIDDDVVRIEILGQFPKAGQQQFINNDAVYGAQQRVLIPDEGAPLIMGVDVARFGDDYTVVRFRQGRDARSIPPVKWRGMDTIESADKLAYLIDKYKPDAVCIDSGAGTGVIDTLKSRKYRGIHEILFGTTKGIDHQWANKRTAMYADLRDWLPGGCLDNDPLLFTDLTAVDYGFYGKAKDQIILESKEGLKGKIGRSPDDGDALALTFAVKVGRRDQPAVMRRRHMVADGIDYDPLAA